MQLTSSNLETEVSLAIISNNSKNCTSCILCKTAKQSVPGVKIGNPKIMLIGEGPGAEEDKLGKPFVGSAGNLLQKTLNLNLELP